MFFLGMDLVGGFCFCFDCDWFWRGGRWGGSWIHRCLLFRPIRTLICFFVFLGLLYVSFLFCFLTGCLNIVVLFCLCFLLSFLLICFDYDFFCPLIFQTLYDFLFVSLFTLYSIHGESFIIALNSPLFISYL